MLCATVRLERSCRRCKCLASYGGTAGIRMHWLFSGLQSSSVPDRCRQHHGTVEHAMMR
jgi:hypothetical protein